MKQAEECLKPLATKDYPSLCHTLAHVYLEQSRLHKQNYLKRKELLKEAVQYGEIGITAADPKNNIILASNLAAIYSDLFALEKDPSKMEEYRKKAEELSKLAHK